MAVRSQGSCGSLILIMYMYITIKKGFCFKFFYDYVTILFQILLRLCYNLITIIKCIVDDRWFQNFNVMTAGI